MTKKWRFATRADLNGFTAFLWTVDSVPTDRIEETARITCCGLRGDDNLWVSFAGEGLWTEYLKETGELDGNYISPSCFVPTGPIKRRAA